MRWLMATTDLVVEQIWAELDRGGEDEDSKSGSAVVYNKKKQSAADNKLHFSSGPLKTFKESEEEKQKASVFEYESSRVIQVQNDSKTTATLETETEFSKDARARSESVFSNKLKMH